MTEATHKILFGNPSMHEISVERGAVSRYTPRPEIGKDIIVLNLPDHMAQRLIAGGEQLDNALETYSPASFLTYVLTTNPLEPWEIAFKYIAECVNDWARAGVDWVDCEDSALQSVLAKFFGCEEGGKEGYGALPALAGGSQLLDAIPVGMRELVEIEMRRWPGILAALDGELTALTMTEGFKVFQETLFSTEGPPFKYMAVSTNATTPAEANKELAGEVTTASGGLLRQAAGFTYSAGSKEGKAILKAVFEMKAADVSAGTKKLHKFGLFNKAVEKGVMGIETEITLAELENLGDSVTITDTITLK